MDNTFDIIEIIMFFGNILFFFGSKKIFQFLYQDDLEQANPRISLSLFLTGSLFILQIIHILLIKDYIGDIIGKDTVSNIFYSILTIYLMLLFQSAVHYIIKLRLGKKTEVDGKKIVYDSPSSRMWSLITFVIILFSTVYINIQIWSAASLMETTGIVGITLGALALTNGVWFPDIYAGIIILKSKSFDVGDVISFANDKKIYIVNKINFFNISLLDVEDNNRSILPNNLVGNMKIHNLSKISTQQGLRRTITYKIGYPKQLNNKEALEVLSKLKQEPKYKNIDLTVEDVKEKVIVDYIEKVRKMAEEVQNTILEKEGNVHHLSQHDFRVGVENAGDFAIDFVLSYYIKPLPKSFVTEKIREFLIRTPLLVNETMLIKSYKYGVDLSTPIVYIKKEEEVIL